MKSAFASVAAALLLAGSSVAQLMVNTPLNVVVCQPTLISWTTGSPPYFLSIVPGNQPGAAALLSFPSQTATSITWTANFTVGTTLGLDLRDSSGTLVQSGPFTINPGTDTSCLTASTGAPGTSVSGTSATTPATTPTAPATTPPATTPTTPVTTPSKPATTSAGTASKSSGTPAPTSGAAGQNLNLGFAGVLGAALVALLA